MSISKSIPLQESLLGRIKLLTDQFRTNRPQKQAHYPQELKNAALEAIEAGIAVAAVARACKTSDYRVSLWQKKTSKEKRKKVTSTNKEPINKKAITAEMFVEKVGTEQSSSPVARSIVLEFPNGMTMRIPI